MPYAVSGPVAQSSINANLNWLSTYNVKNGTCQTVPLDHVLTVMDFSENISQVPQDEIESAHFTIKQVT